MFLSKRDINWLYTMLGLKYCLKELARLLFAALSTLTRLNDLEYNSLLFDVGTIPYMVFGPAVNQGSIHATPD